MRIQKKSDLTREILINYLIKGICQTSFTKVKDGSNRVIYCTLDANLIPTKFQNSVEKVITEQYVDDPDILPIWDVVEGKWKSFRISKMVYFLTHEELFDENEEGHSTKSNTGEILKEKKEKVIKEFRTRVEELKEKAKKTKEKLSGE